MSEQSYLEALAMRSGPTEADVDATIAKLYIPKHGAKSANAAIEGVKESVKGSARRGQSAFTAGYAQARKRPKEGFAGLAGQMGGRKTSGAAVAGGLTGAYRNQLLAGGGALGVGGTGAYGLSRRR